MKKAFKEPRFILVTRETRLQGLIRRFNTRSQAKFYIEQMGMDFKGFEEEDRTYHEAVSMVRSLLVEKRPVQPLDREFLPNYLFGKEDIVVVVGQDGLVANTLKYSREQPVLAFNPDPKRYEGKLLPFRVPQAENVLRAVLGGHYQTQSISLALAKLTNGQEMVAVNDLFIGPKRHTSAFYEVHYQGQKEIQSSSGIIVSTGLGSTGWFKSILSGAMGIAGNADPAVAGLAQGFPWDSEYLYFSVREPYPSVASGASIVFGQVSASKKLQIVSNMAEEGVIFSDGILDDYLEFNASLTATIEPIVKGSSLVV